VKAKGRKNITMDIILKCNLCQKKKKKNMQRYLPHTLKKKTRVECACGP